MRILVANDGFGDAGGVQIYLDAVIGNLVARGHELALAYCSAEGARDTSGASGRLPRFHIPNPDAASAFRSIQAWAPDICYSHNMDDVGVDRRLGAVAPIVKFMHGYFGTCIGGLKTHMFPSPVSCDRVYGPECLALYFPRHCGQLRPMKFLRHWRAAESHRQVRDVYATYVVASEHMRREYIRSGIDAGRVVANPLFCAQSIAPAPLPPPVEPRVVFLGRMTALKGGDLLVKAVAHASTLLGQDVRVTFIGDGAVRAAWQTLAARLGVSCEFRGWISGAERWPLVRDASVLAVPSIWPEPFGLVGLEAGAVGVPAVAVDVGGIREWLRDGVNGVAVGAPATPASFGAALARVLGDRHLLMRLREGALQVAREMTVDRHVDRLDALFSASCSRH